MRKSATALALLLLAACEASSISAPPGSVLLFEFTGKGVNTYTCRGGDGVKWAFQEKSDEALFDSAGRQVGTAIATPYSTQWKMNDGSTALAEITAKEGAFNGENLPDLLLDIKQRQGNGMLTPAQTVRRVYNRGGTPPANNCNQPGGEIKRPFSAVYQFYGARK